MKFGIRGQLTDVITCVKFLVNTFRGYGVLTPSKLPFPIDLLRHPYNSALPCDTVINLVIGFVAHCEKWCIFTYLFIMKSYTKYTIKIKGKSKMLHHSEKSISDQLRGERVIRPSL